MVGADLARVAIIGLIPLVTEVWQVYALMFLLNVATSFFTPAFRASIPQVTSKDDYPKAIALSGATTELLGVLGPAIAGGLAVLMGVRPMFWLVACAFLLSALLIMSLRASLRVENRDSSATTCSDVRLGTCRLDRVLDQRANQALGRLAIQLVLTDELGDLPLPHAIAGRATYSTVQVGPESHRQRPRSSRPTPQSFYSYYSFSKACASNFSARLFSVTICTNCSEAPAGR